MEDGSKSRGRDERGRFTVGNPGGPGGSRRRAFALRRAVEEAISADHVGAMIRKATRMGLEGNLSAMRFVLDRVCGRPAEAAKEPEAVAVAIPQLRTAADCHLAVERLINAIVQGAVDRDVAKLLIEAIQARLKAIEVQEFEERLAALERASEDVGQGSPGMRRC